MKFRDVQVINCGDTIDTRPGAYYVSVVDAGQFGLLAGPFGDHPSALNMVDAARRKANDVDPRSAFYGFGTCRLERSVGPGVLNDLLKI